MKTEGKILTYIGIMLAIDIAIWGKYTTWQFVLVNVAVLAICVLISYVEFRFYNSHRKWIDWIFYFFSKARKNYVVKDKVITYHIKDAQNASYENRVTLKALKTSGNFEYVGRYCWDQDDIQTTLIVDDHSASEITRQDYKWSKVFISFDDIIHKNSEIRTGYSLDNLIINNLHKHTYLSCRVVEKIKHLKLIARVDPSLNPPSEAFLVVEGPDGEEIVSPEPVPFNQERGCYEKTIEFPRKGRKYVLKWDIEKKSSKEVDKRTSL